MVIILDGKKVAGFILNRIKSIIEDQELTLSLAIVLCGERPESVLYTAMKQKKAAEIGIVATIHRFPENILPEELCAAITKLNQEVDGIIVQLPLPKDMDPALVLKSINPSKDVDGLTIESLGKVLKGNEEAAPATPKGIINLLEFYNIPIKGKKIVIINHSNILGKPLAMMLVNRGATVTICHEFTTDLAAHTQTADILICGVGIPHFIRANMIKENAVIIDVGINRMDDKIIGDIDFEGVQHKASYITPVPGGVGPVTVATLLENVVNCKLKITTTASCGDFKASN